MMSPGIFKDSSKKKKKEIIIQAIAIRDYIKLQMESNATINKLEIAAKLSQIDIAVRNTEDIQQLVEFTSHLDYFQKLNSKKYNVDNKLHERICSCLQYECKAIGQPIIHYGEISDRFFFILQGQVIVLLPKSQDKINQEGQQLKKYEQQDAQNNQQVQESQQDLNSRKSFPSSYQNSPAQQIETLQNRINIVNYENMLSKPQLSIFPPQKEYTLSAFNKQLNDQSISPITPINEKPQLFLQQDLKKTSPQLLQGSEASQIDQQDQSIDKKEKRWRNQLISKYSSQSLFGELDIRDVENLEAYFTDNGVFKYYYVRTFNVGSTFGELGLLEGKTRSATILCSKDSEFGTISKQHYECLLAVRDKKRLWTKFNFIKDKLLPDLKADSLIKIFYNFKKKKFSKNERIYKQGEISNGIYLIKKGEVQNLQGNNEHLKDKNHNNLSMFSQKAQQTLKNQSLISQLSCGELFGEEDIVEGEGQLARRRQSAICVSIQVSVYFLDNINLLRILKLTPQAMQDIKQKINEKINWRQQVIQKKEEQLQQLKKKEKEQQDFLYATKSISKAKRNSSFTQLKSNDSCIETQIKDQLLQSRCTQMKRNSNIILFDHNMQQLCRQLPQKPSIYFNGRYLTNQQLPTSNPQFYQLHNHYPTYSLNHINQNNFQNEYSCKDTISLNLERNTNQERQKTLEMHQHSLQNINTCNSIDNSPISQNHVKSFSVPYSSQSPINSQNSSNQLKGYTPNQNYNNTQHIKLQKMDSDKCISTSNIQQPKQLKFLYDAIKQCATSPSIGINSCTSIQLSNEQNILHQKTIYKQFKAQQQQSNRKMQSLGQIQNQSYQDNAVPQQQQIQDQMIDELISQNLFIHFPQNIVQQMNFNKKKIQRSLDNQDKNSLLFTDEIQVNQFQNNATKSQTFNGQKVISKIGKQQMQQNCFINKSPSNKNNNSANQGNATQSAIVHKQLRRLIKKNDTIDNCLRKDDISAYDDFQRKKKSLSNLNQLNKFNDFKQIKQIIFNNYSKTQYGCNIPPALFNSSKNKQNYKNKHFQNNTLFSTSIIGNEKLIL